MSHNYSTWICCQLGAREHYAIPRALSRIGRLDLLITDIWLDRSHPLNLIPEPYFSSLRERYNSDLNREQVKSFNQAQIAWELSCKYRQLNEWQQITARNLWWQKQVLKILKKYKPQAHNITLFAYSYAALELFCYAKSRGWKTILGQIDPGIIEEQLIIQKVEQYPKLAANLSIPLPEYWTNWQQECALADKVIVNSDWSNKALQQASIAKNKTITIPLAYQASKATKEFVRTYPNSFDQQRPLKVLFLGQIIIRKGIAVIFETIELLADYPIEFWFVGQIKIALPNNIGNHPKIKWMGAVSRNKTSLYYQQADVFLFPTHSDGFGLTQLEAQAWKLPLISSQFCGSSGQRTSQWVILPNITGEAIAQALIFCLHNPQELARFSENSNQVLSNFSLSKLTENLTAIDIT